MNTLHIGCHLSASKGFMAMGEEALSLDADTFAFFTRNPRGGKAKALDEADVAAFIKFKQANHFATLVAHAPYTMNPCAAREGIRNFAKEILADDLSRMENVPGNYYNLHPGSHVGQGEDVGIELTAATLNSVLKSRMNTTVLLETMAGKGSEIGKTFQELKAILDLIKHNKNVGICFDTCHVWDAGYDIVNCLDDVLTEFDQIIGLDRLLAVHLNDSLNPRLAHKDRHAKIGQGEIGLDALTAVINHPYLRTLPFILETPNDHDGYAQEISLLRSRRVDD